MPASAVWAILTQRLQRVTLRALGRGFVTKTFNVELRSRRVQALGRRRRGAGGAVIVGVVEPFKKHPFANTAGTPKPYSRDP